MSKLATTASLDNLTHLHIKDYRKQLNNANGKVTGVTVDYSVSGQDYQYTIATTKTACHYGGYRYWFLCPKCSKRVGVLYCAGIYVCRHCVGLGYQSQLEQPLDRAYRRLSEVKKKLGATGGRIDEVPLRPKGMHQRTYQRLINEHINLAGRIMGHYADKYKRG